MESSRHEDTWSEDTWRVPGTRTPRGDKNERLKSLQWSGWKTIWRWLTEWSVARRRTCRVYHGLRRSWRHDGAPSYFRFREQGGRCVKYIVRFIWSRKKLAQIMVGNMVIWLQAAYYWITRKTLHNITDKTYIQHNKNCPDLTRVARRNYVILCVTEPQQATPNWERRWRTTVSSMETNNTRKFKDHKI
jgi:hypothetical protein